MTPKAEALIDGLIDACIDSDNISADYQALVAYIEELERKAAYHDALMAMQTEELKARHANASELKRKLAEFDAKFRNADPE